MAIHSRWRRAALPLVLVLLLFALKAHAQDTGVLDDVTDRYQAAAAKWAGAMQRAAGFLFWSLALISMVWSFGMMALRRADIGEFFVELIKFLMFTGLFYWMLTNAPAIATAIMNSLKQLGGEASGTSGLTPSGIVDVGFKVFDKVVANSSMLDFSASLFGMLMAAVILGILALVAVNMVVLLISGWILAYAGIFFLGFGGARWTSDIAINYYKTVLAIAGSLMGMVLLVGIGQAFITEYYEKMTTVSLREIGVMLIASIFLLVLCNKVPGLIGGIVSGGSIGGAAAMGSAGAGSLVAAGALAGAAAATAVTTAMAGATSAAGWGSAVSAAMQAGGAASRTDTGVSAMPGASGGTSNSASNTSSSSTPFGASMGDTGATSLPASSGQASAEAPDQGGETAGGGAGQGKEPEAAQNTPSEGGTEETKGRSALSALGSGIAAVAKSRAGIAMDAARERVSQTTGGRVAAEIRNPGSAQADRQNHADIARSQTVAGKSQAARNFMQSGMQATNTPPAFTGDSLAGFSDAEKSVDASAEIAAFANRKST